ncbi:MAG: hypothetical protein R6V58_12715 [Planctomycetota bacterium]
MLSPGAALAATSPRHLEALAHDLKTLARGLLVFFTALDRYQVLGLPLDRVLHVLVAAGVFLVAARLLRRRAAALITLGLILAKEAFDVPAKLKLLRGVHPPTVTTDSMWDAAAGLLGLAVAFGLVTLLGDRWRTTPRRERRDPLPPLPLLELPRPVFYPAAALTALVCLGTVAAFELHAVGRGVGSLAWVPHLVVAVCTVALCRWAGPGGALVAVVAVLPLVNVVHRAYFADPLNAGSTAILILVCCTAVRAVLRRRSALYVRGADWAVALFALVACAVVLANGLRLGWTFERALPSGEVVEKLRAYWLIPPLTGLGIYLAARNALTTRKALVRALAAFAASFGLIAAIGIVEFFTRPYRPEVIPGALFGEAPALGVYLSLCTPLFVVLAVRGGVRPRWLFAVAATLGLVCVVLTFNRSAWAATGVATGVVVLLVLWRRDWVLGLACAAAAGCALWAVAWSVRYTFERSERPYRTRVVRDAASVFLPGEYDRSRARVVRPAEQELSRSPLLGATGTSAHTLHHSLALSYGIPGAILLAGAVAAVLAGGWAGAWRSRKPLAVTVVVGATGCVLAAALNGMGWSTLRRSSMQPFFWFILGLVPAALCAVREPARPPAPPPRRRRRPLSREERTVLLVALLLLALSAVGVAVLFALD